eukprot:NODE_294_length_11497_cov_0.618530.p4 type:complete len:188 gc:universal NODE_294_length_11497_cov_0.618530:5723-6286(+)
MSRTYLSSEFQKKKRNKFSKEQTRILDEHFAKHDQISIHEREKLAECVGLTSREVQVWYQNKRAKVSRIQRGAPENLEARKRQMINVRVRKTSSGIIVLPSPISPSNMGVTSESLSNSLQSYPESLFHDIKWMVDKALPSLNMVSTVMPYSGPELNRVSSDNRSTQANALITDFFENDKEDDLFNHF